jgi:hypothetical protein
MGKSMQIESQRLSVKVAVVSSKLSGRWSLHVTDVCGIKGSRKALEDLPPIQWGKSDSNIYALHVMARQRSLSLLDKCVCGYRGSLTGWVTGLVPEYLSGGRGPVVAMKRGNARGAKGTRILVPNVMNQREGVTS